MSEMRWQVHCDIRRTRIARVSDGNIIHEVAPERYDSVAEAEKAADEANQRDGFCRPEVDAAG
ncbi:hypothetical protein [Microbacterium lacticum]